MLGWWFPILATCAGFLAGRLWGASEGRRAWRGGDDPSFQGDGWRWTLSILLPNWLLWRSPDGYPNTVDQWPLTPVQRATCRLEWEITQTHYQLLLDQTKGPDDA